MKTLIVEDDFTSRIVLQGFLSRYGECHTVNDGFQAIEAFNLARSGGLPYELICMDIMMPGMDGTETVRLLRAAEEASGIFSVKAVKIIMTTSVTSMRAVVKSFHSLCDAYLTKPIDTAMLLGHLQTFHLV
jgi:two-component system chemotaxis response regulator CheY